MEKRKKKYVNIPDGYSLFSTIENENKLYAINSGELKYMHKIQNEFLNKTIPDEYFVKAYKVGKTGVWKNNIDEYSIVEDIPINCKINILIPVIIELL
jgi:hypothetical protein